MTEARHPDGCAFCPAELPGLERDSNGDPLCVTCPHVNASLTAGDEGWFPDGDPRDDAWIGGYRPGIEGD